MMTVLLQSHVGELDRARWRAIVTRDRREDGAFWYGVSSTRVYCRPWCPSRRPRPDRVVFFDTPSDAERAGYRPCRRCRPDMAAAVDLWAEKIRRACVYLADVEGHLSLAQLAARLGGSPYHLQRNFKRLVGLSPREYAEACRLGNVKRHLRDGHEVTGAIFDAGYGSSSRFYERAAPKLGMTPSDYRRGGAGLRVAYTIADSALGRLLVAATRRGVCAIAMDASDEALERGLRREYPEATIVRDDRGLSRWVRQVLARIAGGQRRVDLPLDVRATAFQWQMWQALAAIPCGETRTYSEIAAAIGRPRGARAVARGCASNPVAIAIPCHRVVPQDGGPGGYKWGTERKKALLTSERERRGRTRTNTSSSRVRK